MLQQMHQEENCCCHSKEDFLQQQRLGEEASLKPQAFQQEGPDAQVRQTQEEEEVMWLSPRQGSAFHTSHLLFSVFVDFSS